MTPKSVCLYCTRQSSCALLLIFSLSELCAYRNFGLCCQFLLEFQAGCVPITHGIACKCFFNFPSWGRRFWRSSPLQPNAR